MSTTHFPSRASSQKSATVMNFPRGKILKKLDLMPTRSGQGFWEAVEVTNLSSLDHPRTQTRSFHSDRESEYRMQHPSTTHRLHGFPYFFTASLSHHMLHPWYVYQHLVYSREGTKWSIIPKPLNVEIQHRNLWEIITMILQWPVWELSWGFPFLAPFIPLPTSNTTTGAWHCPDSPYGHGGAEAQRSWSSSPTVARHRGGSTVWAKTSTIRGWSMEFLLDDLYLYLYLYYR